MRDSQRLQRMGLDFTALGQSTEGYLADAHVNSERFVKMNLLIAAIADKEKLEVTDADVDKEIERRAKDSGRKPLAIRARLEAEKKLDSLKEEVKVAKVEDFLIEKNTVKYVAPKAAEKTGESGKTGKNSGKAEKSDGETEGRKKSSAKKIENKKKAVRPQKKPEGNPPIGAAVWAACFFHAMQNLSVAV